LIKLLKICVEAKMDDIKKILQEFPDKIREKEELILSMNIRKEEILLVNKSVELFTANDIASELLEDGKSKFSNEIKRKAELDNRLQLNNNYLKADEEFKQLEKNIKHEAIILEYMKRLFTASNTLALTGIN